MELMLKLKIGMNFGLFSFLRMFRFSYMIAKEGLQMA